MVTREKGEKEQSEDFGHHSAAFILSEMSDSSYVNVSDSNKNKQHMLN